ncbi:MAG: hypothetical protein K6E59_02060 [Bacilli bacterium]|nr:hypothetical protein [Bacilli bacterium]
MKYSSTTRLINTIVFAILAFGFGFLGIREGILVAPFIAVDGGPVGNPDIGWGLSAMLGVFGLTGTVVSGYGLVNSVLSIIKDKDDDLVRKSFASYIAIGYTIALFCLINAAWLYRLTSTNIGYDEFGFVIVVFAVLFLVALIVSNIPMVRLYGENEELNKIMRVIVGPIVGLGLSLLVVFGLSYLVLTTGADRYMKTELSLEFGVGALFGIVTLLLSCLAFLGYGRAAKQGVIKKSNGLFFEGSLLVLGGGLVTSGIFEYLYQSKKNAPATSLVARTLPNTNANYLEFSIMAWILGGLLILGACYLIYSTLKTKEAK